MNREYQVQICKQCQNKKLDLKKGILCGITSDFPDFEEDCEQFTPHDESYKEIAARIEKKEIAERLKKRGLKLAETVEDFERIVYHGANWFYLIAGLSIINSIAVFAKFNINFIIGLGITQLINGFMLSGQNTSSILGLMPGILVSGIFATLGMYARQFRKWAYLLGMILYGADTFLFLFVKDWLSIGFHVFVLFMLLKGYKGYTQLNKKKEEANLA